MDPNGKKPAVASGRSRSRCRSRSCATTRLETRVPWRMELRPRRAVSRCVRCHNHGFTDQIKNHMHFCSFQTCKCRKCAFFSEHGRVLPDESALKRERGACLERRLTRALVRSGAAPRKDHSPVKNLAVQAGVFSNLPRGSAGWSGPRIFVSVLDSSSLEEATNNFSFQGFPQEIPAQHAPRASDQTLVYAASEWQEMREAAEALLILRHSSRAPSGSFSPLQLCVASAPAGDRGLRPPSPSLQSRLASSVSLPLGHPACISFLR